MKASMELELLAEKERTSVDPFDDPIVEWIDAQEWALHLAGDKIKEARHLKKFTQKQLAEKLGIPQSQISRIERNPDKTTVRTLKKVAKALGVDVSTLI
ncbi:MAG: helix-turn-helix domain-containing protein [Phycisphaerae bacterium]